MEALRVRPVDSVDTLGVGDCALDSGADAAAIKGPGFGIIGFPGEPLSDIVRLQMRRHSHSTYTSRAADMLRRFHVLPLMMTRSYDNASGRGGYKSKPEVAILKTLDRLSDCWSDDVVCCMK